MNNDLSNVVYFKNFTINNNDNTVDLNYSIPTCKIQGTLNISLEDHAKAMANGTQDDPMYGLRILVCKEIVSHVSEIINTTIPTSDNL